MIDDSKIIAYWEEAEQSDTLGSKCGSFHKLLDILGTLTVVQL